MKYLIIGLLIGLGMLSGWVIAANLPIKYASSNYDAQAVVLYGYTSSNALTPVLVNGSGAVVTTSTP